MNFAQYPVTETVTVEGGMISHLFATDTHWVIAKAVGVNNEQIGSNVEDCSLTVEEVENQAALVIGGDDLAMMLNPPGPNQAGDTEAGSGLVL